MSPLRLVSGLIAIVAVLALAGCGNRSPQSTRQIAEAMKTGLRPDEAWIVTRLQYTEGGAEGHVHFRYGGASDGTDNVVSRALDGGVFSMRIRRSGEAVVARVKAGRIQFSHITVNGYIGRDKWKYSADIKPGTITYIGDLKLTFGPNLTFNCRVLNNPDTLAEVQKKEPALFEAYPLETNLLR